VIHLKTTHTIADRIAEHAAKGDSGGFPIPYDRGRSGESKPQELEVNIWRQLVQTRVVWGVVSQRGEADLAWGLDCRYGGR
jgi:hypothetical protein